jgi:hypothetical protein
VLKQQIRLSEYIPALEQEVAALGRAFGASSVESSERVAPGSH